MNVPSAAGKSRLEGHRHSSAGGAGHRAANAWGRQGSGQGTLC